MLIEESTASLAELLVRWMQLSDGGKEVRGALMSEEVQQPDELPVQAT